MPCDRRLKPRQTPEQRKEEIRKAVETANKALLSGRVKAIVRADGAVAFNGLEDKERDGVTDNCLYRRLMSTGSAAAKMAIARAEMLAGRKVDRNVVNSGVHSHDGGRTWHEHKG